MKSLIIWTTLAMFIVFALVGYEYLDVDTEVEYIAEAVATTSVEVEEEMRDVIEKAKEELDRINSELDAEESYLLSKKAEIEARLESIKETRMSF